MGRSALRSRDFEILEPVVEILCPRCHSSFRNKPGLADKPAGRCQCGGWICPSCLACQATNEEAAKGVQSPCLKQSKRLAKKLGACPSNVAHKKSTSQNAPGSTIGSLAMVFLPPKWRIFGLLGHAPSPPKKGQGSLTRGTETT